MHGASLILTLLWQIALILGVSRTFGMIFARLRQPQVIGEMVAGIMLGPSFFGLLAPNAAAAVFPPESVTYLNVLSQIGVIIFLFLIGLELDRKIVSQRGRSAVVISQASIFAPFVLGAALAFHLYPDFFDRAESLHFTAVALFMGAAMSVTAFPVLARILTERNLHRTPLGAVAITCAAVSDLTAWCMLAFVVGISRAAGMRPAIMTTVLAAAFILGMFFLVRPLLRRLEDHYQRRGRVSREVLALILVLVLGSAMLTEAIGIHALFGAFLMGAVMPKGGGLARELSDKLEDFTVVFLLPIFFAYAGLNTRIGLLDSVHLWGVTLLVIGTACAGKFGGATLAARFCGMGWRESSAIGILMNTRGLMELVILNIGRELGVISDAVFAMMVLMALVTTGLTTPVLQLIYPDRLFAAVPPLEKPIPAGVYSVMVSIARPENAPNMISLARILAGQGGRLLALHLRPAMDRFAYRSAAEDAEAVRDEVLERALRQAELARDAPQPGSIEPISLVSGDPPEDIVEVARSKRADLVIVGRHKPVFGQTMLGGTVHRVLQDAPTNVGVLVDRGGGPPKRVLVPYLGSPHDRLALELARRVAQNVGAEVTVLHVVPTSRRTAAPLGAADETTRVFQDPTQPTPVTFRVLPDDAPADAVIREAAGFDLVIIGVAKEWGLESHLFGWRPEKIAQHCPSSLLIVRQRAKRA